MRPYQPSGVTTKNEIGWSRLAAHLSCCTAAQARQTSCHSKCRRPLYRRLWEESQKTEGVGLARVKSLREEGGRDMTHECRRRTRSCPGSASPTPGNGFFPARQCQTGESGTQVERIGWNRWAVWDYFGQAALEYLPVFNKQLSIRPKHCASVVQLSILLLRDGA